MPYKPRQPWNEGWIGVTIMLMLLVYMSARSCAHAGPYLELGIGDFVGPNDWPDSPACGCGVYLGNEGVLGLIRAGIETRPLKITGPLDAVLGINWTHISNTGTGQDTGIDAAFITVRIE